MILYIPTPYYPFENAVFAHGTPRRCPMDKPQRLIPPLVLSAIVTRHRVGCVLFYEIYLMSNK